MGSFESGRWILTLLVYFLVFYLISLAVISTADYTGQTADINMSGTSGFRDESSIYEVGGFCDGNPPTIGFQSDWDCYRADIDNNVTCNNLEGCTWENASTWLGVTYDQAHCSGYLNTSYYGCGEDVEKCCYESEQFQESEFLCEAVGCDWTDVEEYTRASPDVGSVNTLWESVKFMTGFSADFGIDSEYSWIVYFLFFWLPFIALAWAIYMSIPVIH